VQFFERDDVTLARVYPALTWLKRYMRENAIDTPMEGHEQCRPSLIEIADYSEVRTILKPHCPI
jgi:hypothetical protein